jgi:predicted RNase H-like nuclease
MADTFVGVDWSGGSWLGVAFDAAGFDHAAVFEEVGELWQRYEETASLILVDIPIGLLGSGSEERQCDELAREILGAGRDTVVTPPVREAARKRRYPVAKRVNERKAGQPLSRRAFEMSDGISAVDSLLRNVPEAKATFRGSHPEVCFRAFAGDPLEHPKATAAGYAERMRTLANFDADAPPAVQAAAEATAGAEVDVEDVLDAVVLAYTGSPGPGSLRTLPPDPPLDPAGLPMEIVYRARRPLVADEQ